MDHLKIAMNSFMNCYKILIKDNQLKMILNIELCEFNRILPGRIWDIFNFKKVPKFDNFRVKFVKFRA